MAGAGRALREAHGWAARFGSVRLDSVQLGTARLGSAQQSAARLGNARLSTARLGWSAEGGAAGRATSPPAPPMPGRAGPGGGSRSQPRSASHRPLGAGRWLGATPLRLSPPPRRAVGLAGLHRVAEDVRARLCPGRPRSRSAPCESAAGSSAAPCAACVPARVPAPAPRLQRCRQWDGARSSDRAEEQGVPGLQPGPRPPAEAAEQRVQAARFGSPGALPGRGTRRSSRAAAPLRCCASPNGQPSAAPQEAVNKAWPCAQDSAAPCCSHLWLFPP